MPCPYTTEQLVDERNKSLYEEILAQRPIVLGESDDACWGAKTGPDAARISCAPSAYPVSCFTHELLHIELDLAGRMRPGYLIEAPTERQHDAFDQLVEQFLPHSYNSMAHTFFYPRFRELGFPANEFLADDDRAVGTAQAIADVKGLKKQRKTMAVNGIQMAYPFFTLSSPHDDSSESREALRMLQYVDRPIFDGFRGLLQKLPQDSQPDFRWYHARLFNICGLPNIGFGQSADDLIWARDCTVT
jgi:hypothetical protein